MKQQILECIVDLKIICTGMSEQDKHMILDVVDKLAGIYLKLEEP